MKRRTLALFLSFVLLLSAFPTQRAVAASDVCFISLNDKLLELSSQALTIDSTVYVPGNILDYFKIYYSYHAEAAIATLYTSNKQVYFDLNSGNTYNSKEEYYSGSAVMSGGRVYVPLALVCTLFDLSWSYINGEGYGDVCRIKDGSEWLTDAQFFDAASTSAMKSRYEAYHNGGSSGGDDPGGPGTTPTPDGSEGALVYLSFQGLPSDKLLDLLHKREVATCFFLTADDVNADPDRVRRIVGEGHSLGVLCISDPASEYEQTSALMFEACNVATVLIASSSRDLDLTCISVAAEQNLVFCDYQVDGVQGGAGISYSSLVTAYLDYYRDRADVRIQCSADTDSCMVTVLSYMESGGFMIKAPSEVSVNN